MAETTRMTPGCTALLVMDYQQGIVDSLAVGDDLLGRVARAISVARQRGATVGYVRVAFDQADFDALPPRSAMAAITSRGTDAFRSDSPATAIHPSVAPQPGDIVVRKTRVGAFSTTDLHRQLQQRGISCLVLAGIATSGVVLSTLRGAADRDYRVAVLADACADRDPEVHRCLVDKVFPRQAAIVAVDQLHSLLGKGEA